MNVGIIGAGISGLSLAYELQKAGIPYQLWEAAAQPGGYVQSRWEQPHSAHPDRRYLCELGPNSLLGGADLLNWIDELGLTNELVFSNPVSKARYIFRNGQYRKLPAGPPSLLFGNFFSWQTKWAIFRERNNRTVSPPGETLGQFFRRRFSPEIVEYALGPFVAGIYAGDPEKLLVAETFPILLQYEQEHGSVLRGLIKNQSAAERRQSFSFRDGMQTLPNTLAGKLDHLMFNTPVTAIHRQSEGWAVETLVGTQQVDWLVLTGDTRSTAKLLDSLYPDFAGALRKVDYPPMTVVHSAYRRADVSYPLNGFGGLNPAREGRFSSGHIWSSSVFDGRCPADEVLFTTFVGGQQGIQQAQLPITELVQNVHDELTASFGISAQRPAFQRVYQWPRAIPQYDASIALLHPHVEAVQRENLLVCANWNGGVSLSDCIRKGRQLAKQIGSFQVINNF